ncbi:hypothetical protein T440DRAFT_6532 [Plenodomus tracheiphilus IPT5]|uniref:Uncharacterized protein n=1 Tax=Plenodomus tracheiphilus IPT5 TaxID=1408161 RepID=A0A6A7BN09_9PLEO|nr:hypothetical protein T440DRAFT_6532 [Plenodomus tracheiphilus IPT5]
MPDTSTTTTTTTTPTTITALDSISTSTSTSTLTPTPTLTSLTNPTSSLILTTAYFTAFGFHARLVHGCVTLFTGLGLGWGEAGIFVWGVECCDCF